MPDLPTVLRRHGVNMEPPGTDRHVRPGWVGAQCPFCVGSPGLHLGYNVEKFFFNCWRCGFHPTLKAIEALCHVDRSTAIDILRSSDPPQLGSNRAKDQKVQRTIGARRFRHPTGVGPMSSNHRRYLTGRGFDPDQLAEDWGVEGTGPLSSLDRIDYRFRLFIPIHWRGEEVSFQTRDVTGKSDLKYKACPMDRELVHHKHIVYRHPEADGSLGIAVEGVADAWRLGHLAFATFGIQWGIEQVHAIASLYRSVAVIFDSERVAIGRARDLSGKLSSIGVRSTYFVLDGDADPGSMSPDDAWRAVETVMEWDARE